MDDVGITSHDSMRLVSYDTAHLQIEALRPERAGLARRGKPAAVELEEARFRRRGNTRSSLQNPPVDCLYYTVDHHRLNLIAWADEVWPQ